VYKTNAVYLAQSAYQFSQYVQRMESYASCRRFAPRAIFNKFLTDDNEELKEEKVVQFAAEVTKRFTSLEAAQDEVTPEDL